jgi:hypothetical protein
VSMREHNIACIRLTVYQEEYLRRARSQAIPYKQIAVHLQKTELACRLHFHQINSAHRRQSNLTQDDARGEESLSPEWNRQGAQSRLTTPTITVSHSSSPYTAYSTSPACASTKTYTSPASSVGTEWASPQTSQTCPPSTNAPNFGIGLTWPKGFSSSTSPPSILQGPPDLSRLLSEYADNSRAFFSSLANQFPQSPAELELAFRTALAQMPNSPSPQPDRHHLAPLAWPMGVPDTSRTRDTTSPQGIPRTSLLAPSPKRCTVSSLLNFEKDIGSHRLGVSGS